MRRVVLDRDAWRSTVELCVTRGVVSGSPGGVGRRVGGGGGGGGGGGRGRGGGGVVHTLHVISAPPPPSTMGFLSRRIRP